LAEGLCLRTSLYDVSSIPVGLIIEVMANMNISAFAARQKVTRFVVDEISTQLCGREPTLVVGERICWRVPVRLSLPPTGDLGDVGAVEVDVETGQLQITEALIQGITLRATELASRIVL
jgi:hypothetical protein